MNQPILRPPLAPPTPDAGDGPDAPSPVPGAAYPKRKGRIRPGWKATLIRVETFRLLRAIQTSTRDPAIDLSYLTEACLQIALEHGPEAIVSRALESFRLPRSST